MDVEVKRTIGERVRDLRTKRGISLRQFAIDEGFNPNVLSRIERGHHNMTIDTLFRLSHSLKVLPADLLRNLS